MENERRRACLARSTWSSGATNRLWSVPPPGEVEGDGRLAVAVHRLAREDAQHKHVGRPGQQVGGVRFTITLSPIDRG